jgi:site-specific DNA recombinase
LVLAALAQRVFRPERVKLMLEEFIKRRRAARTVEDARLLALRKELDQATRALNRLYEAVELGRVPQDETLRARAQKHQAARNEALLEIAKLEDRKLQGLPKLSSRAIEAFSKALEARLKDVRTGFGKGYLRVLVDEIRLEGNQLTIRGSYARLGDAFLGAQKDEAGRSAQPHT